MLTASSLTASSQHKLLSSTIAIRAAQAFIWEKKQKIVQRLVIPNLD